jgi:tetratricopeptide (TPR) repeat protein
MSEMLGNHYFLVRNYEAAIKAYEKAFPDRLPKETIKKLIICHLANDNFETAKQLFRKLLLDDPHTIINTNVKKEDCPCPELIGDYESKLTSNSTVFDFMRLAMLWLYCDAEISLKYFSKTKEITPKNNFVDETIKKIKSIINQTNQEVN